MILRRGTRSKLGSLIRRRPFVLITLFAISAVSAALVWVAAFLTPIGERVDRAVFAAFTDAGTSDLAPRISRVVTLADPLPFLLIGLALTGWALARRRWALGALVPVILLAANLTTQALKILIPHLVERAGLESSTEMVWPSGHSTASMSLALCAVLVAGPRLRPVAAMLGAGYAVAVGYALVASSSHMPSDVLGGYLVAAAFASLGAAGLTASETSRPDRDPARRAFGSPLAAPAAGAIAVVAMAGAAVLARGPESWDLMDNAPAMVAGASIAALGVTLIATLARALQR
jgi:membrane-associated phospholipid phosphatase